MIETAQHLRRHRISRRRTVDAATAGSCDAEFASTSLFPFRGKRLTQRRSRGVTDAAPNLANMSEHRRSNRPARAPRCTNCAAAPGHSAVTISPRWAMDAGDGMPCWRGFVARLIDRVGGCSTAAAATAAAPGMLHGGDEPQHAGQPSGSILLDRCTGKTWLLLCIRNDTAGCAFRWAPIPDATEPAGGP